MTHRSCGVNPWSQVSKDDSQGPKGPLSALHFERDAHTHKSNANQAAQAACLLAKKRDWQVAGLATTTATQIARAAAPRPASRPTARSHRDREGAAYCCPVRTQCAS